MGATYPTHPSRPTTNKGLFSQRLQWIIAVVLMQFLCLVPICAQEILPEHMQIYVQDNSIKLDVRINTLFSQRTIDAIESGMTASIALHFRIVGTSGEHVSPETVLHKRLQHDIWEGTYRLIHFSENKQDTLVSTQFDSVKAACSDLQGIVLAKMPMPDRLMILQTRIVVNPITPEQQARTRQWLKILKKGSLLDFFFSLEKPTGSQRWNELLTFRPRALPHLIKEGNR